jgi:hypothetical protein
VMGGLNAKVRNAYILQWSSPLSIDNNMVYLVLVPTIWRNPCQLMYFSMRENSTSYY